MSTIKLSPKQSKLFRLLSDNTYRRYLIDGSARSGKTASIMCYLFNEMKIHNGIRIACLRQHKVHARTTLWDGTIKKLLAGRTDFILEETGMKVKYKDSLLVVDCLEDNERVDRILGSEWAHIYIDEATQCSFKSIQVAISRLAQNIDGLESRKLIMSCNPKSQHHFLYTWCFKHLNPETLEPITDANIWAPKLTFYTTDNPALPLDAIESLKALSTTERKRLYEGLWCSVDNLVYPSFNIEQHVKHRDVTNAKGYIIGCDAGMNDPMVIAVFAILEENNIQSLHLNDLLYTPGKDMSYSIADAMEKYRIFNPFIVCDPSASPMIVELKARGFNAEPANNKLSEGIIVMRDYIDTNRFTIEPSISEIPIMEITQYEMNPITEKPKDNTPHHFCDGARYALQAFKEIEIPDIVCIF